MVEFTGERVVPGRVNNDLWSEHLARYAFARRFLNPHMRALDAGCGTGYGSAELAQAAGEITGIDNSAEAIEYAREHYPLSNLIFTQASCLEIPAESGRFHAVIAFEVIEHLRQYRRFLEEARRVLRPGGLFLVSTPNRRYYGESRAVTGPNPFHEHEFDAEEFHGLLSEHFPNRLFLAQNRVESFAFHPIKTFWPAAARIDGGAGSEADAHFFIAVCSDAALPEAQSFVYVPRAANLLREREQHVELLHQQLAEARQQRDETLKVAERRQGEIEASNHWAQNLDRQLVASRAKAVELEAENEAKTVWARETEERLGNEVEERTRWARSLGEKLQERTEAAEDLARQLDAKCAELSQAVDLLHAAEDLMGERTRWAQALDAQVRELAAKLDAVRSSRWLRVGRAIGIGPALETSGESRTL